MSARYLLFGAVGERRGFGARAHTELAEQRGDMVLDRALRAVQPRRNGDLLGLAQARDDARLVDEAVGRADAAAEVALEGPDGEVFGDEAQRGCRGEAGAVLGEEVQRWLEVGLVWGSRLEI